MITNAVRDLRGQEKKHRTMMVNISVYVDVQKKIAEQLEEYVRDIQREVQNYYKTNQALQYASFAFLKEVYDEFYSSCYFNALQNYNSNYLKIDSSVSNIADCYQNFTLDFIFADKFLSDIFFAFIIACNFVFNCFVVSCKTSSSL